MTKKKIAAWLGIILTAVTIIGLLKSTFFSDDKTKTASTKIISNVKGSTVIDGNGNNIQNNSFVINNSSSSSNKIIKKKEYGIKGFSNKILLEYIKNYKQITFVNNSNNVIEITYTGEISSSNNDSEAYFYSGGNVLIKVDNIDCFEFENLKISEMKPNSKNEIINEIKKKIDDYINKDPKLFLNKITECISTH